jgi:two-component system, chemotaxis family, protein-glutamate methylesterase/glutaminase
MNSKLRILLVDDSRLFRSAIQQQLATIADVVVVGSVFNGTKAIDFLERNTGVDLVLLDQEMPEMDGIATLACINRLNAERTTFAPVGVIMVSAHTKAGAAVTLRALQSGAFDFITKPSGPNEDENLRQLRSELVIKLRSFVDQRTRRAAMQQSTPAAAPVQATTFPEPSGGKHLRLIAIAASTGGPKALGVLLPRLTKSIRVPVVITQHMPQHFTASLAETLSRQTGKPVVEAGDGQVLEAGTVYIAPGGRHLVVRRAGQQAICSLSDAPPENGCKPSADVMFRSVAQTFGGDVVAIILTGMGNDGAAGATSIRAAGGYVIAQDEASSIVWGMPGSAVAARAVDAVHPLGNIAGAVELFSLRSKS